MNEFDESAVLTDDPQCRILRPSGLACRFGRRKKKVGQVSGGGDGGSTRNQGRQPLRSYIGQTPRVVRWVVGLPGPGLSVTSVSTT